MNKPSFTMWRLDKNIYHWINNMAYSISHPNTKYSWMSFSESIHIEKFISNSNLVQNQCIIVLTPYHIYTDKLSKWNAQNITTTHHQWHAWTNPSIQFFTNFGIPTQYHTFDLNWPSQELCKLSHLLASINVSDPWWDSNVYLILHNK